MAYNPYKEARRAERRAADDARYEAEVAARAAEQAEIDARYGHISTRLEELGIDPSELAAYLSRLQGSP